MTPTIPRKPRGSAALVPAPPPGSGLHRKSRSEPPAALTAGAMPSLVAQRQRELSEVPETPEAPSPRSPEDYAKVVREVRGA